MNCFLNKHTKNQYWPLLDISHYHFMEAFNGDDFHNLWFCLNLGTIWWHLMIILTLFENYQLKQQMIFLFHSFSEFTNRNGGVVLVFEVAATPRVWKSALDPLLDSNILLQSYCGFTQFYTVSQKKLVKSHPSPKESSTWPYFTHLQVHLVHDILITMERSSSVFHSIIT